MQELTPVRLQKYLADCGLGSRRACEELITNGDIAVDGIVVTELGVRVSPKQKVTFKGKPVSKEAPVTLLINKPVKVICTSDDPQGRTTVLDLLSDLPERVYTVGRLDYMSEGLIMVTNDGELAHALMHPRYHVQKVYHVWIDQPLGYYAIPKMKKGIANQGETLRVLNIEEGKSTAKSTEYIITLGEGRNRHIRRMMEHFDRKVVRLMRTSIGPIRLDGLKPGEYRPAKPSELKLLRKALTDAKRKAGQK
jgi:23S rRNA pseudouridine2605 synthase